MTRHTTRINHAKTSTLEYKLDYDLSTGTVRSLDVSIRFSQLRHRFRFVVRSCHLWINEMRLIEWNVRFARTRAVIISHFFVHLMGGEMRNLVVRSGAFADVTFSRTRHWEWLMRCVNSFSSCWLELDSWVRWEVVVSLRDDVGRNIFWTDLTTPMPRICPWYVPWYVLDCIRTFFV